ncbi:hypothetical protein HYALB_00008093 [Hymenoscyphus albidus]|uniref:SET domain-containing protein n=1 Tax=Hymenoscyphus albidus TaxID=595503 RepID=A0A9N9M1Q6_9HELO|nr:hypothetical protein HYALB_00008093 [Hymenoscyphus albidus]
MHRETLSPSTLPAWSKLNDISFFDIHIQDLTHEEKGLGLVATRKLNSKDTCERPTLMEIPGDLVLSAEGLEEWKRVDGRLREVLERWGGKSLRRDIMVFLLIHISREEDGKSLGVKNPWTEYVKVLPGHIPVPTMWSEEERMLLTGTSLEPALAAKMSVLTREFEELREATESIAWCYKCWWQNSTLNIEDWVLLDAWFRSRSLELPNSGESMVPCMDMANHSSKANSYYEQTTNGGVVLLLRPDMELEATEEITFSYGDLKSDAEMLFSYGFIDEKTSTSQVLVLPLEPMSEDPLGKAKIAGFMGRRVITISTDQEGASWTSPFLYFICLNEEDGLDFKVLQQTDGEQSPLRVFWRESDVTEVTDNFESLIEDHELQDVFKLRVVTLLEDHVESQLERLNKCDGAVQSLSRQVEAACESTISIRRDALTTLLISMVEISPTVEKNALRLRASEMLILQKASTAIETQKAKLLESEVVLRYLGMFGKDESEESAPVLVTKDDDDVDEDFS